MRGVKRSTKVGGSESQSSCDYGVVFCPARGNLFPSELVMVNLIFPEEGLRFPVNVPSSTTAPVN